MIELIVGLPHLSRGPILHRARRLGLPVLISANALSLWRTDASGVRHWDGFNLRPLANAAGLRLHLDSAGFVTMRRYRNYVWTVERYVHGLAARYPFEWFASCDLCVEPEIAADHEAVLDRVAGTVNLNIACRRAARDAGIERRLMPVIQGWRPEDYLRCLELLCPPTDQPLIGVGSMCRRHLHGQDGILHVIDVLARALEGTRTRLHLFGLKGTGAEALRGHPIVASIDSQAYGVRARRLAIEARRSKTNAFVADVMEMWVDRQRERMAKPGWRPPRVPAYRRPLPIPPSTAFEARIAAVREQMRMLVAEGEMDHDAISPNWLMEWAADLDEDELVETAPIRADDTESDQDGIYGPARRRG